MKKIWNMAEKIGQKTGFDISKIFVTMYMLACGAVALIMAFLVDSLNIIKSLDSFEIYFILIGYVVIFIGFFGGSVYAMNNE